MWFNRPTYNSYTPYDYGYSSFEDPYARAVARERAAREREAAARRADLLRWQQIQDAARSPYNSYLSDDGDDDDGAYIPSPYQPRAHSYTPYAHEDLKRRQALEQQRQHELARQAELSRRREVERSVEHARKPQRSTPTSTPHFSIPISSPREPSPPSKPTRSPKRSTPPPSPKPAVQATPEQIRAAMTIQEFYRSRTARRQALTSIAELSTQFEQLKSAFSPPIQLDYRGATPDSATTITVSPESFEQASSIPPPSEDVEEMTEASESNPALAFTTNNKVVHEYIENLNRLLDKLDRVESGGHAFVRDRRKELVKSVEAEAQRMDRWIAAVWDLAQAQPKPQRSRQLRPQPTMEDVFAKN